MVKRAVLVGINYYGSGAQLAGCINDIRNIKEMLVSRGYTEFVILHDGNIGDYPELGPVQLPTRENIKYVLKGAIAASKDGDYLYWHYSGHGSQLRDQNGDEADGMDEAICPVDYDQSKKDCGFIRDDWLRKTLCEHGKKIKLRAIMDCCHSGSICDLPFMYKGGGDAPHAVAESKALRGDFITISGCKDNQTSADAVDDAKKPSGAMTWAILKALSRNKQRTWAELVEYMRGKLRKAGYDQIPQLCVCAVDAIATRVDF